MRHALTAAGELVQGDTAIVLNFHNACGELSRRSAGGDRLLGFTLESSRRVGTNFHNPVALGLNAGRVFLFEYVRRVFTDQGMIYIDGRRFRAFGRDEVKARF
ncbi:MAG: hypothetical protein U5P41_14425 [Gammaproteobacteria bacterium]|nr:hypothetical protein [Gammaproteobacteria bacterium]